MNREIFTDLAPRPIGPYSQAVMSGGMIYCSGQIPLEARTGQMVGDNIGEQTKKVCENISEVLKAAGVDFSDVIKTTCFLVEMSDFAGFNEVYERYFVNKPARSCVVVKELPKGALIEIEVIASVKFSLED